MGCGPSRFGPVLHLKGALVASMSAEIGAIVPGTVVRIAPYGAFVKLESGETGPHISEIDRNYVRSVEEHLRVDDAVTVKVVGVKEDGKIDLSIKQAASDWQPEASRPAGAKPRVRAEAQAVHALQRGTAGRRQAPARGPARVVGAPHPDPVPGPARPQRAS